MRILIAGGDTHGGEAMRQTLAHAGFTTDLALSADHFHGHLAAAAYRLYVVDRALPDCDGLELVRALRAREDHTPALMICPNGALDARVESLDGGADDVVAAPVHPRELLARTRALLRRPPALRLNVRAGRLEYDPNGDEVLCCGSPVALRRSERRLLVLLLRRPGRIVPRQQIENALRAAAEDCSPNALEQTVSRLRKTLRDLPCRVAIRTERGAGYALDVAQPHD